MGAYIKVVPVIDYSVRNFCTRPYPGHPRGCPNYGKRSACPPQAPYFEQVFDLNKPIYAICNVFHLRKHVELMRARHPNWTDRQLRCCLYWQPKARKQLAGEIERFKFHHPSYKVVTVPEALGVNITETMKRLGVDLEWPPQEVAYQVALAGYPRERMIIID